MFIIFGATGDLAKRKLIPAIYRLIADKKIDTFVLVGVAIDEVTVDEILNRAKKFITNIDESIWRQLCACAYYYKINFVFKQDYAALATYIEECEQKHNLPGNRLLYLATAADFFCPITHNVAQSGIIKRHEPNDFIWHRVVYEKPFGHDLKSAHEINTCIAKWLNETQIYRIDHYLTKELVSNIALIRFTNCVFEPLWNNRYIDQVQIVLSESVGIESRGAYYDKYGALRDVVQNHMLELLALICMEAPEKLTGDYIRSERVKVLERVKFVDGILGQYESYLQEKDVRKNSQTDTFAALYLTVNNPRWVGVPFYLKTGKALDKKETVISIKFKQVDCLLLKGCPTESNWLTIKIAPEATFLLNLNAKKPGRTDELVSIGMEFCHSCVFGPRTPEAYEVLFEEVVRGEQSISVRFDEIEYAWKVIDQISAQKLPVHSYKKQSAGPKELEDFSKKHGMRWRS